eukprot:Filipodium_phascolosomae@DN78_c0_g1_i2.p1
MLKSIAKAAACSLQRAPARRGIVQICRGGVVCLHGQSAAANVAGVSNRFFNTSAASGNDGTEIGAEEAGWYEPLVSKPAEDFAAEVVTATGAVEPFTLSSLRGKYVYLLFYPFDFTFVCPTELLAFNEKVAEFESRNVQLVGVSVDSVFCHSAWRNTPINKGGIGQLKFPLVSDITKSISRSYGVLMDEAKSLRGLFLIDREGIVRHAVVNDLPLGRSVDEALRMVDSLVHFETNGEVCPANWKKGTEAMQATPAGVASYLAEHFKE